MRQRRNPVRAQLYGPDDAPELVGLVEDGVEAGAGEIKVDVEGTLHFRPNRRLTFTADELEALATEMREAEEGIGIRARLGRAIRRAL